MNKKELETILNAQAFKNELNQFLEEESDIYTNIKGQNVYDKGLVISLDEISIEFQKFASTKYDEAFEMEVTPESKKKYPYYVNIGFSPSKKNFKPQVLCDCPEFDDFTFSPCKHVVATILYLNREIAVFLEDNNASAVFLAFGFIPDKINGLSLDNLRLSQTELEKKLTGLTPTQKVISSVTIKGSKDFVYKNSFTSWEIMDGFFKHRHEVSRFPTKNYTLVLKENGKIWQHVNKKNQEVETEAEMVGNNTIRITNSIYGSQPEKGIIAMLALQLEMELQVKNSKWHKQFNDYSKEKAEILAQYGLDVDDPLAKEFAFEMDYYGNFKTSKTPPGLLRLTKFQSGDMEAFQSVLNLEIEKPQENLNTIKIGSELSDTGICFNFNNGVDADLLIEGLILKPKKTAGLSYTRVTLRSKSDLEKISTMEWALLSGLRKVTWEIAFMGRSYYNIPNATDIMNLSGQNKDSWHRTMREAIIGMNQGLEGYENLYLLPAGESGNTRSLVHVQYSAQAVGYKFKLEEDKKLISLKLVLLLGEKVLSEPKIHGTFFAHVDNQIHLIPEELSKILAKIPGGILRISKAEKKNFIQKIAIPLSKNVEVDFNGIIKEEVLDVEPQARIYLSEMDEKFLLFKPKWKYGEVEIENKPNPFEVLEWDEKMLKIIRKPELEKNYIDVLKSVHPNLSKGQNSLFYVNFKDALSGPWFLKAYQQLSEAGFEILGFDQLKKFKYNKNKASLNFSVSSGIDWFDVSIEVSYGDEIVPLEVLRQAFANGSQYVVLGDGSFGMLPDEWLKKFSSIFKLGKLDKETGDIKVKKLHWTIIDQFHAHIDDAATLEELNYKKERLKSIETIQESALPKQIKAKLRDYQVSGFQWLSLLHEMNWAGCLADDMGLGKTLQTITFLQHIQNQHPGKTHLIVCPTSLIFNWENELKKFAPKLGFHIHYGADREWNDEHFEKHDIVITSYGNLRSDIEQFVAFRFGYVILDESQAIKNPAAQISKAVRLLKADNRLVLSGTPVQNNTFDLYSQFDFLNPGLLGSQEFFRNEFANPIDKNGDKDKTELLRKMVNPFMLRRTKDQVAKDLPAKTEMILWCEMEKKQRIIYNTIKDQYRSAVLGKIEEDGMAKSGIYILQGLLKLRQVCNSPALLSEEEKYPNVSVKLEELMRELEENTGDHKVLVFSQFTSMLSLIEKELSAKGLTYSYLDGSVSQKNRKMAVDNFQNDPTIRIFLISLMAGGVGLNLTAADYVYLVDPWWNPAAEQQAIDRTHRIGQNKNVFAYKMICKDTVEEKIIELQKRKKDLASDLITEESGFVKKLTRDDVEFLFG